jgi:hypothetical protein
MRFANEGMKFDDAMTELRAGKRVKRKCWLNAYLFLGKTVEDDGRFKETLYLGGYGKTKVYPVKQVATSCILGEDWEIVEG